ncbi:hypothetical protein MPTK1_8g10940 [Marchantia polymorpha subsp. ruderalis]|uniref:Uncharacterized protein n=1 Tax=Marchantia polymorpha TaxID=3197 RepID=A0A2R6XMM1_MARPO|nr:hypothetical protein MARPO_0008s0128 [Marchantia polymorpha]BBN19470.1 hypothetical protein Mp_8g10940 [Marchantia polymorpha subsp. ruderalis]|eukprot:PTQ47361.1 hypothetical protein MARPO_0008s0128 [Marchantia polymorpha]
MARGLTFLFLIILATSLMVEEISATSDTAQLKPSISGATRRVWDLIRGAHFENVNFEVWEFDESSKKENMRTALPTAFTLSSSVTQGNRKLLAQMPGEPGVNRPPNRGSPPGPTG